MSDWEDQDFDAPVVIPTINESWEDEDVESEPEPEVVKKPAKADPANTSKPKKKKAQLEEAIREKELAEQEKERAKREREEEYLAGLSEVERKMYTQKLVEESDMQNTVDTFMVTENSVDDSVKNVKDSATIDDFYPKTDKEFEKMAELLGKKINSLNSEKRKKDKHVDFLKVLLRHITVDLSGEDIKALNSHLTVIMNEKLKAATKANKGIKKPVQKKQIKMEKDDDDYTRFDDDYDDFM